MTLQWEKCSPIIRKGGQRKLHLHYTYELVYTYMHKHNINRHVHDVYMYMHSMFRCKVRRCTCTYKAKDIYDISHKILPIQSILRVPVQKVWTLNGTERKGTELPFSFSSFFFALFKGESSTTTVSQHCTWVCT